MLRKKNLSNEFITSLIQLSSGRIQPKILDEYFSQLEKEINRHYFTVSSESNLLRIIKSQYDIIFFISESIKYPHYIEIQVCIASNSNYLSDILVISPEYFSWIVNPSTLKSKLESEKFNSELTDTLKHYKSIEVKVNALKNIKKKEILRIGLKDIYIKTELNEIVEELSILANAISSQLFTLCYEEILLKYSVKKIKREYCLVALGKLGGMELNYSSDIDLIIFYDKDYKISGRYYSEILSEAIKLFVKKISSGEAGFLYRVDFRLRPDGKTSPLCRSIHEYLNYYESRGEDWERQMLIKAKLIGGSKSLFDEFINYVTPFIYPSAHSFSPMIQIQRIKHNIEKNLTDDENIKLAKGGIRDIEFPIQALQLLNGGKHKSLRTGGTLSALAELQKLILLTAEETEKYKSAYVFYRKIEHYMQLMNNRQTHDVPREGELTEKLSYFLGFKSVPDFNRQLDIHRKAVRNIYESIINSQEVQPNIFSDYTAIQFKDIKRSKNNLLYLREGKGLIGQKSFDKKSINAFLNIESLLIGYLRNSHSPDKLLDNFVRVIKSASFPSIWYAEFRDEKFFNFFLTICEYSQRTVDLFAEDKTLRELFLSREVFKKTDPNNLLQESLKKTLFRLPVLVTVKILDPVETSEILSEVVRNKIKLISKKFASGKDLEKNFFAAVLGSTGSGEMTFSSDVDLIFLVKNITRYPKVEKEFQQLLDLLRNELRPFPVDCRLRPEGKSSQLVWDFDNFVKYYQSRARIWELQSLLKINFITGNKKLFETFMNSAIERITSEKSKTILSEMKDMRKKIIPDLSPEFHTIDLKKSSGGLTDVEYLIHYLILSDPQLVRLAYGKPFIKTMEIVKNIFKPGIDLEKLSDCCYFLKQIIILNQLFFSASGTKILTDEEHILPLVQFLKIKSTADLIKRIDETMKTIRSLSNKYLK